MNYSLNVDNPLNISLLYNETDKNSFPELSDDSKNLKVNIGKNINDNISVGYKSELDLKNNFSPYSDSLSISLSDECSMLSIVYSNVRYNDNFNTTPKEKLVLYYMDYLGYFGYEQSTDLFLEK